MQANLIIKLTEMDLQPRSADPLRCIARDFNIRQLDLDS